MTTVKELYAGGFPIYTLKRDEKRQELLSLLKYDRTQMIQDGVVGQSMHSMGLCWHYHPHAWSVKCGEMLTPMEVFADAELLQDAIARRNNLGGCVTQSDERKALRTYTNTQGVSGFRATAAAAIFDRYLPSSGGTVWDMSAGYGGRLLGALACPRVHKYIGTDPATRTYDGLRAMQDEITAMMREMRFRPPLVELHQIGSEDFKPEPESLDLCFTSPPYGPGHEQYSEEETQSYKRYPTNEQWMNGYMRRTLENCRRGLKPNGWLVVNLAPVPSYPRLVGDFLSLAADLGWCRKETLKLALSKIPGAKHLTTGTHKHEPVFAFPVSDSPTHAGCIGAASVETLRLSPSSMPGLEEMSEKCQSKLRVVPLHLQQANELVTQLHRHHKPIKTAKFSIGCTKDGKLVGAAICMRPACRALDDGKTVEVCRLVTDGTDNACSLLYAACSRAAKAMGYAKIQTYILDSEPGTSLKAAGWMLEKTGCGGTPQGKRTNRPNGHETTPVTFMKKQRWAKRLMTQPNQKAVSPVPVEAANDEANAA